MSKFQQYVNTKINQLTILELLNLPNGVKAPRKFKVLCDCGKITEPQAGSVLSGRTKTCGHGVSVAAKKNRIDDEQSFWRHAIYQYKNNATQRGREWALTDSEAKHVMCLPCSSCGLDPQPNYVVVQMYKSRTKKQNLTYDETFANSRVFNTTGIDRIDNSLGYSTQNVVPMCRLCNQAKHTMTVAEWMSWLDRIVKFQTGA